jgi:S-adenosyl methyltransferase
MAEASYESKLDTGMPHSARIWNYWLGGTENFAVDREVGDAYIEKFPAIVSLAKEARRFLIRVVRYLAAEAGSRQFLDIGSGLPTMENTHEVAQLIAPDSRIVYVDNDPLVLAHARALLVNTTDEGVTAYVDGDFHKPDQIVADARNVLNFGKPIAVMFMGVLGFVVDYDEMRSIVSRVMAAVPAGSYLALWDGTDTPEDLDEVQKDYEASGAPPYIVRSPEQIGRCFEGLEMLEPGLVSISQWRPGRADTEVKPMNGYGAVARKP